MGNVREVGQYKMLVSMSTVSVFSVDVSLCTVSTAGSQ